MRGIGKAEWNLTMQMISIIMTKMQKFTGKVKVNEYKKYYY